MPTIQLSETDWEKVQGFFETENVDFQFAPTWLPSVSQNSIYTFLQTKLIEYYQEKIKMYEEKIQLFEEKYKIDFITFDEHFAEIERDMIEKEDDYMDWEFYENLKTLALKKLYILQND